MLSIFIWDQGHYIVQLTFSLYLATRWRHKEIFPFKIWDFVLEYFQFLILLWKKSTNEDITYIISTIHFEVSKTDANSIWLMSPLQTIVNCTSQHGQVRKTTEMAENTIFFILMPFIYFEMVVARVKEIIF